MAFLRAAWAGRVRLWITYWILGVAGNMSFVAVLAILGLSTGDRLKVLMILVWLASLAWFVFVFGAIWRAAGAYEGPRIWAVLARAGVLVGIVRMAAEAWYILAL
jgi:hypothetical protein